MTAHEAAPARSTQAPRKRQRGDRAYDRQKADPMDTQTTVRSTRIPPAWWRTRGC
ncbi:hypothetical protein [Verminephrobacter eiseniae]|uniref:hypothetical protein n=1 Tax=Verminephrobacter eiseniae TaxID=364317 RepID=UPI0022378941|nr:hypothetical protein [Verminephrobacter eiseniae]